MNVDKILETLNAEGVSFILIGGMNFLLRHFPELTFDVDIWVQDTPENLSRVNRALQSLGASWGPTEATWAPIPSDSRWLHIQQTITWAEANMLPHLRRNRPRLPKPWPRSAESDTPPQDPHGS